MEAKQQQPKPGFETQLKSHLKPFASDTEPEPLSKEWHALHDGELEKVSLEYAGIHTQNVIRNPRCDLRQIPFSISIYLIIRHLLILCNLAVFPSSMNWHSSTRQALRLLPLEHWSANLASTRAGALRTSASSRKLPLKRTSGGVLSTSPLATTLS